MNERESNRSNNQIYLNVIQFQYIFKEKNFIELYRIESVFAISLIKQIYLTNHKNNRRNLNKKKIIKMN